MSDRREAVFLAYSSLLSDDEDIRDLVVTEDLIRNVVQGLESPAKAVSWIIIFFRTILCIIAIFI